MFAGGSALSNVSGQHRLMVEQPLEIVCFPRRCKQSPNDHTYQNDSRCFATHVKFFVGIDARQLVLRFLLFGCLVFVQCVEQWLRGLSVAISSFCETRKRKAHYYVYRCNFIRMDLLNEYVLKKENPAVNESKSSLCTKLSTVNEHVISSQCQLYVVVPEQQRSAPFTNLHCRHDG